VKLSIVTTLYRSAPYLREFHRRAAAAAAAVSPDVEFVFVNDGSPDDALAVALVLRREVGNVKVVDLSRNFGHHPAMMTGLAHATGDRVFLIDCDLEEPPELLASFAAELDRSGADVVYGVQDARRDGWRTRVAAKAFYRVFNLLSSDPIPENVMTVRLMTRRYVAALLGHTEAEFAIAGLWARTGFRQVAVPVAKRRKPTTSYNLVRKVGVFVTALTAFSSRPLHLIFYLGLAIFAGAAAAASALAVGSLLSGEQPAGWPSLIVSVWLLGGLGIFCQGVLGIYLAKVYVEVKRRPVTIVRDVYPPLPAAADRRAA
jgi:putative glycosyltransferase